MTTKTQLALIETGFVIGSVAKRGMYEAAVLTVLLLTVSLMAIGYVLIYYDS